LKTVVIFQRLGPYHHSRLAGAARRMEIQGLELTGRDRVYAWDKVEAANGFERVNLFPAEDVEMVSARTLRRRLNEQLNVSRPGAVAIPGWSDRGGIAALHWCLENRVPVVMMSESTEHDGRRTDWKERIKLAVVKACSTGLVGGEPHSNYLASLGMPRSRIFKGYDAVDNEYFAARAAKGREQRAESRQIHKLPENYFLASARFVEKKNLPLLIQAYARYREMACESGRSGERKAHPWSLVLLGDGGLRTDIARLVSERQLQNCVLLPGFKQYGELPIFYGLASAFIHASTVEQWGLVVNEAMASGLPVLVSNRCGCASDLVQEGRNGFTFDPFNMQQLAELMLRLSLLPGEKIASMGVASRAIIADWGPERFATGLQQAVETALRVPQPKPTMLDRLLLRLLLLR
jgi:1,2-diacylglycerol 3-alpha-glucosyltransferase